MRWFVSIGVVLVAGVITGGDVASMASPSGPTSQASAQLADKDAATQVGRRTDPRHRISPIPWTRTSAAVQREGYAQAIVSKEFLQALKTGPNGKVSITYFEQAAAGDQKIIISGRLIDGPETAEVVASEDL